MNENEFKNHVLESSLSSKAKFTCFLLLHYRNRKTGDCYPSQQTLSDSGGVCRNTINSAIIELKSAGFLEIKKYRPKNARYSCNYYHFSIPCPTIEQSSEQSSECSNERSTLGHKPIEPIEPIKKKIIKEKIFSKNELEKYKKNCPSLNDSEFNNQTQQCELWLSIHGAKTPELTLVKWLQNAEKHFKQKHKKEPKYNNDWMDEL